MIEQVMFFAIGFLVASLLGIVLVPLVHNRAVRLTMRRLEAATPLSMAEIQADKDQLRAEFAMSTRRLEMSVEEMKAKTTAQLAELGKKSDAINRLRVELGEKTATIFALEAREKALRDQLRSTEEEFSVKTSSLREAERTLAEKQAELAKLGTDLDQRSIAADSQRIELVALRTQVDALKTKVADGERDVDQTQTRMDSDRSAVEQASRELAEERGRVENLGRRVGELERALLTQTTEAEMLGRRVLDLERRLADQGRALAEREYECGQLRSDIQLARQAEAEMRAELASANESSRPQLEGLKSEKAALEQQLATAHEERDRMHRELTTLRSEAESNWAAERVEQALLRERINDVAAEIARLTVVLEGQGSPIEAILAAEQAKDEIAKAEHGVNGAAEGRDGGTLAERIRALKTRASRLPQPN